MNNLNKIKKPKRKHRFTIRLLITIGLLSILNFFFWFLKPELIENKFLFWCLTAVLIFDSLRIIFLWYHYWNISIPKKPKTDKIYSVDVLTTYFPGEPYGMITETLKAIKAITYPHTTYLCDEADDPYLKEFCKEHNIIHITRKNKINAKAGNINNALKQATGEICLILDPDHVPFPEFLDETIAYFEDDNIGYVQTVQAYYNYNESKVALAAAQQTFHFYGPVMMCMNSYGTVNAIGANCVFRREALDSIGGHAPGLSEDMHTAMQLHAKGWKSIYVPKVLTRGLTPATLTAYYKQQLKWSRGTLDLLTSVYPKLFKNFSWSQKLHYVLLPTHYLSGIFFLLGFLIPILSLFGASLPWKGNIVNFGLIYIPMFASLAGIHIYVQQWLLHKTERGLHLLGGVLMICTWWIYLLGFIYTVIGKKIPYLPTPKENDGVTNFKILIPNLTVGLVSIAAIVYGLYIDFTPFTIIMSCFAGINAFFMFFTLKFAYDTPIAENAVVENYDKPYLKSIRNKLFKILNKSVVAITILTFLVCGSLQYYGNYSKWKGASAEVKTKNTVNYIGAFTPKYDNGLSDLKKFEKEDKSDIISLYLPWDKNIANRFPKKLIDSIYAQKSIPLITWEPWLNTFENSKEYPNSGLYTLINNGYFDSYITDYATVLKELNRPIFLRFAHEFDNPFYPWHIEGEENSIKFKTAWIHTYEIFKNAGANNVIWIWNPWKAKNIKSYYPGEDYVDWLGVNVLNYGSLNPDGKDYSFENLYRPFHNEFSKLINTPVIISEFGSLKTKKTSPSKENWINNAFKSIKNDFSEIKSVVYFNSKVDNNLPKGESQKVALDWSVTPKQTKINLFKNKLIPDYIPAPFREAHLDTSLTQNNTSILVPFTKGVNIKKGYQWDKDYHVLTRKNLISDFEKITNIDVHTIDYLGGSIYDYNILKISGENNISISYSFWISESLDFITEASKYTELKKEIINKIKSLKDNKQIFQWRLKNDVLYNQRDFYHKPELLYQNEAYALWVKELIAEIKSIDPERPVVLDIEVNKQTIYHIKYLLNQIENIDILGLVVKEDDQLESVIEYLSNINKPFIISGIEVENINDHKLVERKVPFYINQWQDKHESNSLDFKGIVDRKGRLKPEYTAFLNSKNNRQTSIDTNDDVYNILKPSKLIYEGKSYLYNAMAYDSKDGWNLVSNNKELTCEWSLIKCDKFGNYIALKELGNSASINVKIPNEPYQLYRLHLSIIKEDKIVASIITKLNTSSSFNKFKNKFQ